MCIKMMDNITIFIFKNVFQSNAYRIDEANIDFTFAPN